MSDDKFKDELDAVIASVATSNYVASMARMLAAIERIAGKDSAYYQKAHEFAFNKNSFDETKVERMLGVCQGLRQDLAAGFLKSQRELIHGELFSDFLEMAEHLLREGYKDAAAVICGSSLEAHLRQLCARHGVSTNNSNGEPKKASLLNDELAKAQAYGKQDQKDVTSWLHLRNDAAHGHYENYEASKVDLVIAGVRLFIRKFPA